MIKEQEFRATGRRKTSVASVVLRKGEGKIHVNGREFDDYFSTEACQNAVLQPLEAVNHLKDFDVRAKTRGGGLAGQADAISLGISRALLEYDEELRGTLREHGLLTRDPRMKERKKSGQPGARKRFQFSKR